jgi:hypothetical protein
MVAVLAISRMTTDPTKAFLPNRASITCPSPSSLQAPIRAAMDCTATRSGMVKTAIHSSPYRVVAPATEYVVIPEGSLSEARVTRPGPRPRQ